MAKTTATDETLSKIEQEIVILTELRNRLLAVMETPQATPKPRKARKPRGLPATMPAGEARPIA